VAVACVLGAANGCISEVHVPEGLHASRMAAPGSAQAVDSKKLLQVLAQREAELKWLKAELAKASEEDTYYARAERLGVAAAVEQTRLPERQRKRLAVAIVREAERSRVDPLLVLAVIKCESSFNNYAVSGVGAKGLMQVMPDTGKYLAEKRGLELGHANNLFDPETNVELGTFYLADLIERFGSVENALVAYNAGPSMARKILAKGDKAKKFIAGYPKKVVGEFQKLKAQARVQVASKSREG
jgi:soluble lytic murein transglycosylase